MESTGKGGWRAADDGIRNEPSGQVPYWSANFTGPFPTDQSPAELRNLIAEVEQRLVRPWMPDTLRYKLVDEHVVTITNTRRSDSDPHGHSAAYDAAAAELRLLRERFPPDYSTWVEHGLQKDGRTGWRAVHNPAHGDQCAMLMFGQIGKNPLVRIHSRCLYGDVFGSDECDCRDQLTMSEQMIVAEGGGAIIYLEQDGRGAGLCAKAQGYKLGQDLGLNTAEAYARLGYLQDARGYSMAIEMLEYLVDQHGAIDFKVLSNNPLKLAWIWAAGFSPEIVPAVVANLADKNYADYAEVKRLYMGHWLPPAR